jgi:cytochrome b pre-mRNA-processing protein 3
MSLLASLFSRPFSRGDDRAPFRPLYAALIERARLPHWYEVGAVPDTIDGRFDMVAAMMSLTLIRMEALGLQGEGARLTEIFVEDMDGQIRQIGFGDLVVGKQIGKMMSALGGRIAAYRAALNGEASLDEAVTRNIFRGEAPDPAALAHVSAGLRAFAGLLDATDADALLAGTLPA